VLPALCLAAAVAGCAPALPPDHDALCRIAQAESPTLDGRSVRELAALSQGTPAFPLAASAYAQGITALALGIPGGAAIAAGLVVGLALDPATHPASHTAGLALGGAALGLVGVAWTLGFTAPATARRARARYRHFALRCQ
jgi:hypothetical protein